MSNLTVKAPDTVENVVAAGNRNSWLGSLIILAAEAMFFAGFLAAWVVLEAKRSEVAIQSSPDSLFLEWVALAVLSLAFGIIIMARHSCRTGVSIASHWGANLGIVAVLMWFIVVQDNLWGQPYSGFSELHPADACRLVVFVLLAGHLLWSVIVIGSALPAMLRGDPYLAVLRLTQAERLLIFAIAVQAALTLIAFLY